MDAIISLIHSHTLSAGCSGSNTVDLLLVLDSSGSVGFRNFQIVKQFVYKIIEALPVGPKVIEFDITYIVLDSNVVAIFPGCTSRSGRFHTWPA